MHGIYLRWQRIEIGLRFGDARVDLLNPLTRLRDARIYRIRALLPCGCFSSQIIASLLPLGLHAGKRLLERLDGGTVRVEFGTAGRQPCCRVCKLLVGTRALALKLGFSVVIARLRFGERLFVLGYDACRTVEPSLCVVKLPFRLGQLRFGVGPLPLVVGVRIIQFGLGVGPQTFCAVLFALGRNGLDAIGHLRHPLVVSCAAGTFVRGAHYGEKRLGERQIRREVAFRHIHVLRD